MSVFGLANCYEDFVQLLALWCEKTTKKWKRGAANVAALRCANTGRASVFFRCITNWRKRRRPAQRGQAARIRRRHRGGKAKATGAPPSQTRKTFGCVLFCARCRYTSMRTRILCKLWRRMMSHSRRLPCALVTETNTLLSVHKCLCSCAPNCKPCKSRRASATTRASAAAATHADCRPPNIVVHYAIAVAIISSFDIKEIERRGKSIPLFNLDEMRSL